MMRYTAPAAQVSEVPAWRAEGTGRVYPGLVRGGRLYLGVPFAETEEAKSLLRARWEKDAGHWWVDAAKVTGNRPRAGFRRGIDAGEALRPTGTRAGRGARGATRLGRGGASLQGPGMAGRLCVRTG
ncbi:DUF5710 domain-containing protein [Streptomyces sp. NPDC096033]|uniref:DUF5710 domain-containing protein n=1 Tax=Streptomyces sp. NPDC096033 TaxID=3366071 RepID=UPI0037FA2C4D